MDLAYVYYSSQVEVADPSIDSRWLVSHFNHSVLTHFGASVLADISGGTWHDTVPSSQMCCLSSTATGSGIIHLDFPPTHHSIHPYTLLM